MQWTTWKNQSTCSLCYVILSSREHTSSHDPRPPTHGPINPRPDLCYLGWTCSVGTCVPYRSWAIRMSKTALRKQIHPPFASRRFQHQQQAAAAAASYLIFLASPTNACAKNQWGKALTASSGPWSYSRTCRGRSSSNATASRSSTSSSSPFASFYPLSRSPTTSPALLPAASAFPSSSPISPSLQSS